MRSKRLKICGIIIGIIILLFASLNIAWYIWRDNTYKGYINDCQRMEAASVIVPRYYHEDEEGYNYSIKYPDYLSTDGNLSVGLPVNDENPYVDSLIIWVKWDKTYEYGVLLYEDNGNGELLQNQIYIDPNGNAIDNEDESIVRNHRENIDSLLTRANEYWSLK